MEIRLATNLDLPVIKDIFTIAKANMQKEGNIHQWTEIDYPISYTPKDIENGNCYVIINEEKIVAVFTFIIGEDPTYSYIIGNWKSNAPYGTIHRIASNGQIKHILHHTLEYLKRYNLDIRIDTHKDNNHMKNAIEKEGFEYCGIIFIRDGSERLAYQLQRYKD